MIALVEAVSRIPQAIIDMATVQTNIVVFDLKTMEMRWHLRPGRRSMGCCAAQLARVPVRLHSHRDVSREDCERAMAIIEDEIRG